jgi:hypothetical protein
VNFHQNHSPTPQLGVFVGIVFIENKKLPFIDF